MTQCELNFAVACVTGETTRTIARLGFHVADPEAVDFDPEPYDEIGLDDGIEPYDNIGLHGGIEPYGKTGLYDEIEPYDLQEKYLDWDALVETQAAVLV